MKCESVKVWKWKWKRVKMSVKILKCDEDMDEEKMQGAESQQRKNNERC